MQRPEARTEWNFTHHMMCVEIEDMHTYIWVLHASLIIWNYGITTQQTTEQTALSIRNQPHISVLLIAQNRSFAFFIFTIFDLLLQMPSLIITNKLFLPHTTSSVTLKAVRTSMGATWQATLCLLVSSRTPSLLVKLIGLNPAAKAARQ